MLERRMDKGTTVERLKITQRRENSKAGNYVSGPEIPSQGRNFRPWTKFPGAGNSMNFRPFEIRLCPLRNVVVQRAIRGVEILVWQNFRGPEIL
jgi:hypothetical protein